MNSCPRPPRASSRRKLGRSAASLSLGKSCSEITCSFVSEKKWASRSSSSAASGEVISRYTLSQICSERGYSPYAVVGKIHAGFFCQELVLIRHTNQPPHSVLPRSNASKVSADSSDHADTALANKSSKTSIGLRQFNVLRGLPFNSAATLSSSSCECKDRSVPLGKYWRRSPLVFSQGRFKIVDHV